MQIVVDEMNAFLQSRAGYKIELHRGIPLLKYLDPYRIVVRKMDEDFRSRAGGVTVGKDDNINKMAFCHILLANDDNLSYFQSTFRHECMHAVFGIGDAYTYEGVITDYVEGLMGAYMQTYDLNTAKLLDALYNTMNSDTTAEERLDALADFIHSTHAYQQNIDKYESILQDENYDFDLSDKDVIFKIKGNPFVLLPAPDTNEYHTTYIEIKDGKVRALTTMQSLGLDEYTLSSDTRQTVDMSNRTHIKDGHIFIENKLLGYNKTNNKFIMFDMTSQQVIEYETLPIDITFDEAMQLEQATRDQTERYKQEHGDTEYQHIVAESIKNQINIDFLSKYIPSLRERAQDVQVEFAFDYRAVYQSTSSKDTISLDDNVHVCENDVLIIGTRQTLVKCGDQYILAWFYATPDGKVTVNSLGVYEKTNISLAKHDATKDSYAAFDILGR